MNYNTPLIHGVFLKRNSMRVAFVLIVSVLLTLLSWVGAHVNDVNVASAAAAQCLPLSGDTTPVTFGTKSYILGNSTATATYSNTGAMYFGPYAAGRVTLSPYNTVKYKSAIDGTILYAPTQKPVYYAPNANLACASLINGTVYLQGWVWSDNVGWVSLYCPGNGMTNRGIACGGVKYGVTMNKATGVFSGYAWSNVGWIRMNCDVSSGYGDANYCATSSHAVTLNLATSAVTVPPVDPVDPSGLNVNNKNAWAWTGTPQGSGSQWMSFAGMKVPLAQLVDQKCDLAPDSCLGGDDAIVTPDDPDDAPIVKQGPIGDVGVVGQFPVGVREVAYLNNSPYASSALNPVTQAQVRNLVYKNVLKWKKVASTSCGDSGNFLLQYQTTDSVFYCKGNVHLKAGAKWKGNKTIIVEGGNVIIEGGLKSDKGQLGIVVIRNKLSDQKQGNVYIGPDVRDLHVQIYADGSVYPYVNGPTGPAIGADGIPVIAPANYAVVSDNNSLFGQLYIQGMIIANNHASTEGGALPDANLGEQLRSLGYLRSSPGVAGPASDLPWSTYFEACTQQCSKITVPIDGKDETYIFGFVSNAGALKSAYVLNPQNVSSDTEYYSVYMSYEPPAQDLPVFDGIVGSSLKQTGG